MTLFVFIQDLENPRFIIVFLFPPATIVLHTKNIAILELQYTALIIFIDYLT